MSGVPAGRWELLSLELWGEAPLGHVIIPLHGNTLSLLYGRNGAGKSIVMEAVRAAFTGDVGISPLLSRFRFHAVIRDDGSGDRLSSRLIKAASDPGPGDGFGYLDEVGVISLGSVGTAFNYVIDRRIEDIVRDADCDDALRGALRFPVDGRGAAMATLTSLAPGRLEVAASIRPSGSVPRGFAALLEEIAAPKHEIPPDSVSAAIWRSIAAGFASERSPFRLGSNLDAFRDWSSRADSSGWPATRFVGPDDPEADPLPTAEDRNPTGSDAELRLGIVRNLTAAWASRWLFGGELVQAARSGMLGRPGAEHWTLPVVTLLDIDASDILPRLVTEHDDADEAFRTITRRFQRFSLPGEPPLPSEGTQRERALRELIEEAESGLRDGIAPVADEGMWDYFSDFEAGFDDRDEFDEVFANSGHSEATDRAFRVDAEPTRLTDPSTRVASAARAVAAMLTERVRTILPEARPLVAVDRFAHVRSRGLEYVWITDDDVALRLDNLSFAQERWTRLLVSLSSGWGWKGALDLGKMLPEPHSHSVVLLDEPERGLHRGAERACLAHLEDLTSLWNCSVIVATHSPVMLDAPSAALMHVARGDRAVQVMPSGPSGGPAVSELAKHIGCRSADIAVLHRVFLVVEGEADRVILEELFEDEFLTHRVQVVPMHGTDKLDAALSPYSLFGLTDAAVVILLDDMDHAKIDPVWRDACVAVEDGDRGRAKAVLRRVDASRKAERLAIGLALEAVERQQLGRLSVFGLSATDILELIPPELLGATKSAEEFQKHRAEHPNRWTSEKTKNWIKSAGGDVSLAAVRRAVRKMDQVPEELVRLLDLVRTAAGT